VDKLGYTAPQVAELFHIPYATLDSWARSGFFVPSMALAKGRGTRRLYSFYDLVTLKVVTHLRSQGVNNDLLKYLIGNMRVHQVEIENAAIDKFVISDGQSIFALKQDDHDIANLFRNGKPLWAIPIGQVVHNMREAAKALEPIDIEEDGKVKVG